MIIKVIHNFTYLEFYSTSPLMYISIHAHLIHLEVCIVHMGHVYVCICMYIVMNQVFIFVYI